MSLTYHKPTALCTANVPSQNETEPKRTPAMDGFQIMPAHRSETGNVRWNLIFLDFADFLQVPRAEVLSGGRWTQRTVLEEAATSAGYDPRCVSALESSGGAYRRKFAAAAALGFDPIYLWPARATTWPPRYQTLDGRAPVAAPAKANTDRITDVPTRDGTAAACKASWALSEDARLRLRAAVQAFGGPAKVARATGLQGGTLNKILHGSGDVGAARLAAIASVCCESIDYLMTGQSPEPEQTPLAHVKLAIASAEGFAVAIDCLPVGKDIRNRLQSHIQAHIYLLRLASGDPA